MSTNRQNSPQNTGDKWVPAIAVVALLAMAALLFADPLGIPAWFQADPLNRAFYVAAFFIGIIAIVGIGMLLWNISMLISSILRWRQWCPIVRSLGWRRSEPCPTTGA